jgi:hypothetical protein
MITKIPLKIDDRMNYPITVFLDMDGVLADFDRFAIEKLGKKFDTFPDSASAWAAMKEYEDVYFHLEPMIDASNLVNGIYSLQNNFKFRIAVLTAIPKIGRIPNARQDKIYWLSRHFPALLGDFNIGPHAEHKQYHCRALDVLIDDSEKNIPQWESKGGYGILHTTAEDSLSRLQIYLENLHS